jgi:hypothetical protein
VRGRLLFPFAALAVAFLVTLAFLWVRVRWGPPNPEVRQYIEENPEVLSTLPRNEPGEAWALDDSIAAARQRLLAGAALRLPPAERDEFLALQERMSGAGGDSMTRGETRRLLELEAKCKRLLTPGELEEWLLAVQRLSGQAGEGTER